MSASPAPPFAAPRRHRALAGLDDLLAWLTTYPPLPLQLVLFVLIAWGGLGVELGLDDLLWDDRPAIQLGNGLAVGALFGQILFVRYLLARRRARPDALAGDSL